MSEIVFNLAAVAIAVVIARAIALRGLFFALLTTCGLLLAMFVTFRFWLRTTGLLSDLLPFSEPALQLTAFLILLTLSLQPLLITVHRLSDTRFPDYPPLLETAGRIILGTVSSGMMMCLAATTLTLMQPVGLRQYDPNRWWWPADTALLRVFQRVERFLTPYAVPTPLPILSPPTDGSTIESS